MKLIERYPIRCPRCKDIDYYIYYTKGWEEKGYYCLNCGYDTKNANKNKRRS